MHVFARRDQAEHRPDVRLLARRQGQLRGRPGSGRGHPAARPNVADQALDNKKFQTRPSAVAGLGVGQFLDVGSGLPASPVRGEGAAPLWLATHEAARAVHRDAMVAYVDYDPVAVTHSQALLGAGSRQVVAVSGDMGDPGAILADEGIRGPG